MESYLSMPLAAVQRALRERRLTAIALAEAAIARHSAIGAKLNAYKHRDDTQFLRQARLADAAFANGQVHGPLQGIPVSVKDLFGVQGYPTFAGTQARLPEAFEREGPIVSSLRRQLALMTGKTHTVEFAFGGLGTNSHWGAPWNPWDTERHRVPGGSSAGAGVSLGCDALVALGTDTAGSVRIPASMTGNVGLKTSYGLWSTHGIVPLSPSMDSVGVMTHTVADLAVVLRDLGPGFDDASRPPIDLRQVRCGIVQPFFWEDCSPGISETVASAIHELKQAGASVVDLDWPELKPAYEIFTLGHLAAPELHEFLRSCLPGWLDRLSPQVAARVDAAAHLPAYEYLRRRRVLDELSSSTAARLADVHVLLTPTVAITPPLVADLNEADAYRRTNMLALRNTCVVNLLGLCALTLPVGLDAERMPVGLQLIARRGADHQLVRVGAAAELALGTASQRCGEPRRTSGECQR